MLLSTLFCGLLSLTTATLTDLLLNHGDTITASEEAEIKIIFDNADLNKNNLISFDEYSVMNARVCPFSDEFKQIDLNEDGKLVYAELVYFYKQLIVNQPKVLFSGSENEQQWKDVETAYNSVAPAGTYNAQTEAEFMANVIFTEIDTTNKNYISEAEYVKYATEKQWKSMLPNNDVKSEITLSEFKNSFFDNTEYEVFKDINTRPKSEIDEFVEFNQNIQNSHSNADSIIQSTTSELVYEVHQFDSSLTGTRRRLLDGGATVISIIFLFMMFVWITALIVLNTMKLMGTSCFCISNMVLTLNHGLMPMSDLSVGNYVFDGTAYTKIYFIQNYENDYVVNMLEIKYGNPNNDNNSIILTPHHLLYKYGFELPVISNDINIGDTLSGNLIYDLFNDDSNYTVYDINVLYNKHPINPITMSGNIMVHNIVASVFSYSADEHKILQKRGAIFRWISNNINEKLAANMINFYYNVIYKKFINKNYYIKCLLLNNYIGFTLITIFIPVYCVIILSVFSTIFGKISILKGDKKIKNI